MLISICIPTMNRPEMVTCALQSALNQTYANIEVLVFDNSVNALTECVVAQFDDHRIRYKHHPENIGQVGNYNALLEAANGEYIKFLNDDDCLEQNCVQMFFEACKKYPNIGLVTCRARYFDEDGTLLKEDGRLSEENDYSFFGGDEVALSLYHGNIDFRTPTHTLYHRPLALSLGGFEGKYKYIFDVFLAYHMAKAGGALFIDKTPLITYLRHADQVAAKTALERKVSEQIQMLDMIHSDLDADIRTDILSLHAYIYAFEILLALKGMNLSGVRALYQKMKSQNLSFFFGLLQVVKRKVI